MKDDVLDLLNYLFTVSFDEKDSSVSVVLWSENSFVYVCVAKEKAHY